ncbi:MAG TPA: ADP-ribosylglycohydrolase family protein, partial [Gemmataceae bacterium]|nr:ADP-ribosylglycohydrolase family protein [Gemmataceae bacterium]
MNAESVAGCLVGLAVGDALGLPREGLSPRRGARLYPHIERHQLLFRRGLFSDDTEHACLVAQSLLVSGGDVDRFTRSLARRLRWWFAGLPVTLGKATLKACVKLWLGFPPAKSGVFSAGTGPAMRAPLLGVCLGDEPEKLGAFLRASTRMTHADPKAEYGAFAVAWAAHTSAQSRGGPAPSARHFVEDLRRCLKLDAHSAALFESLDAMVLSVEAGEGTLAFSMSLDLYG